jgi:hypothetical protein
VFCLDRFLFYSGFSSERLHCTIFNFAMPVLFYFCQILFFKFCYDFPNTTKKNGSGIMLWRCCRCHYHNLSSNWLIILNFEHNHSWQWIKVGIDFGYCNPTCFQTRGPKAHTTTKKFNLTDPFFWILNTMIFGTEEMSRIQTHNFSGTMV